MPKVLIPTMILISLIILIAVLICLSNPLRKSEYQIRESILTLTPLGSSMDDVHRIIAENNKWSSPFYSDGHQAPSYRDPEDNSLVEATVIGEKAIIVRIGEYYGFPLEIFVYATWCFDENSNLIDIFIEKYQNAF